MAKPRRGMGRGLAAILGESGGLGGPLREIDLSLIDPNPNQPRRRFDGERLAELAASLKARGILQPVIVRPRGDRYELVAGERRWRAAQLAGLTRVPAVVKEVEGLETVELALIENMAREELSPVEAARACALLIDDLGLTHEEVGKRVGKSRVAITNLLRLLELPDEVLALIDEGALSEGHGRALLMASDHRQRRLLGRQAVREGWSVRETERRARGAEQLPQRPLVARRLAPELEQVRSLLEEQTGALVRIAVGKRGAVSVRLRFRRAEELAAFGRRLAGAKPLQSPVAGD